MNIDIDYVPLDLEPLSKARNHPPEPKPLPNYAPIPIEGASEDGAADLPNKVNSRLSIEIFSLFFDNKIIKILVQNTNAFAKAY